MGVYVRIARSRAVLALSCVSLLLPVAAVVVAPAASAAPSDSAPVAVRGEVVTGKGSLKEGELDPSSVRDIRPAANATVTLTHVALRDAQVGDEVAPTVVDSATADDQGRYTLTASPGAGLLAEAQANDGWVNFYLSVNSGDDVKIEGISRHWNGTGWDGAGRDEFSPETVHRLVIATDAETG
jgi:hypothetical protein